MLTFLLFVCAGATLFPLPAPREHSHLDPAPAPSSACPVVEVVAVLEVVAGAWARAASLCAWSAAWRCARTYS